jgi:F-type H+-transporting ATPase subunit b
MYPVARYAFWSFPIAIAISALVLANAHIPGAGMSFLTNPEFVVAVGFIAILVVFVWAGLPRMVATMLDARAAAIKAELDEAKKLREEAMQLLSSYRAKAASAEKEAATIVAEAKADADRFATEARTHLRNQLERRTQMAHEKIAQAEAQAMADIRAAAADAAAAAAEKLIQQRMTEGRGSTLVAQSVKDLGDKLN